MTIIQKIVKAGDLPPEWAKEFHNPDVPVEIIIREVDKERHAARRAELQALLDRAAAQATERGLTPEILQEILDEK